MSLDYQRKAHRIHAMNRPPRMGRTSYGSMHLWRTCNLYGSETPQPKQESNYLYDNAETIGIAYNEHMPAHLHYGFQSKGYDDFHKAYLEYCRRAPQQNYPHFGPPRMRHGNAGSSWRHVKYSLEPRGNRSLYIDGKIANDDRVMSEIIPQGDILIPHLDKTRPLTTDWRILNRARTASHGRQDALVTSRSPQSTNWYVMR